jgi:hypothetical protein
LCFRFIRAGYINLLEFSKDYSYDFSKDTLLISKHFKKSNKKLKKIKQEKESLILQLSESHVLIDSLKSENNMFFDTVDTLQNKLKESEDLLEKFFSKNLKSMLCIHTDISNKPDLIVNNLSTSTSHASDSELDSVDIKSVIVDAACLDISCSNNCVKPNSKDSGTQGKFVPICHHCGKVGHIRPKCYLLKSHKPWNKQEDSKKGFIEKTSSVKYVPPYRRHISQKGKDFVICENDNIKFVESFKKHLSKISQPTCYHCCVSGHFRPHYPQIRHQQPRIRKTEQKTGKSSSKLSKLHHAFRQQRHYPQRGSPSCHLCGKYGHTKAECFRMKPHKSKKKQINEGLVNMMKNVLVTLINLDMAHTPASQVEKIWVRKDETIHSLRGSGLT